MPPAHRALYTDYLPTHLSICLFVYLSIHSYIYLSTYLSIHLSLSPSLYVYMYNIRTLTNTYKHTCLCMYLCNIHKYMPIYKHSKIHANIRTRSSPRRGHASVRIASKRSLIRYHRTACACVRACACMCVCVCVCVCMCVHV